MGRPARIADPELAKRLLSYMQSKEASLSDMADMLRMDKATVCRTLRDGAFSSVTRTRVTALLDASATGESVGQLLQKSLHLLQESGKLRLEAERMIAQALDRPGTSA